MMKKSKTTILVIFASSLSLILAFNIFFYIFKSAELFLFITVNLILSLFVFIFFQKILWVSIFSHINNLNNKLDEERKKLPAVDFNENKIPGPDEIKHLVQNINSFILEYGEKISEDISNRLLSEIRKEIKKIESYDFNKDKNLTSSINKSSGDMLMYLDETLGHSSEESEKISEAVIVATQSLKAVSETIDGINKIASSFEETEFSVSSLSKRTNEVKGLINQIDEQIDMANHLALNSAIEAARIGDEGRGFAVISDEIKKLAGNISLTTKEITKEIEITMEEIQGAVDRLDNGNKKVEKGISLGNNAAKSILKLVDLIESVKKSSSEISDKIQSGMGIMENSSDLSAVEERYKINIEYLKNTIYNLQKKPSKSHSETKNNKEEENIISFKGNNFRQEQIESKAAKI